MHSIKLWKIAVTTCFAFSIEAMVRGYHVYQSVWEAVNGEVLKCSQEIGNRSDPYAVAVIKSSGEAGGRVTVGHVPRKISICSIFIQRGGIIDCMVTGGRRYSADLAQGGLEIPCILTFYPAPLTTGRQKNYLDLHCMLSQNQVNC